jgi:hypothetical protein
METRGPNESDRIFCSRIFHGDQRTKSKWQDILLLYISWGQEDQIWVTVYLALVYFMGTRGPNESPRIFCLCIFHGEQRTKSEWEDILLLFISWGPEDQMRVTGYFALVYFMGTRGPNESDRIFSSCIFHGDQRTKWEWQDILLLYILWWPEEQMRVTGHFALVYFMGTKGPNESDRIFCSCIFHGDPRTKWEWQDILLLYILWGPEDQIWVIGYFALVYFMGTRGPDLGDRIFYSCIFHGDQRTKWEWQDILLLSISLGQEDQRRVTGYFALV